MDLLTFDESKFSISEYVLTMKEGSLLLGKKIVKRYELHVYVNTGNEADEFGDRIKVIRNTSSFPIKINLREGSTTRILVDYAEGRGSEMKFMPMEDRARISFTRCREEDSVMLDPDKLKIYGGKVRVEDGFVRSKGGELASFSARAYLGNEKELGEAIRDFNGFITPTTLYIPRHKVIRIAVLSWEFKKFHKSLSAPTTLEEWDEHGVRMIVRRNGFREKISKYFNRKSF